ncbi:uncharacterized protein LOC144208862 isoform X2 [Stigmatopora nigra]
MSGRTGRRQFKFGLLFHMGSMLHVPSYLSISVTTTTLHVSLKNYVVRFLSINKSRRNTFNLIKQRRDISEQFYWHQHVQNTRALEVTGEATEPDQVSTCSSSCVPSTLTPLSLLSQMKFILFTINMQLFSHHLEETGPDQDSGGSGDLPKLRTGSFEVKSRFLWLMMVK